MATQHKGLPMFQITTLTAYSRTIVAEFPDFAAAESFALSTFNIVDYERDTSVGYDTADFFTADGTVYAIQPAV